MVKVAGNFEIEFEGELKAEIGIRTILFSGRENLKNLVNKAARDAANQMKLNAPKGKTGGLERRIDWQRAVYRPGGAGGGGTWVATAGVRAGDPYPTHVFHGTGIYGPTGSPITARTGNVMVIEDYKARDMDRGMPLKSPRGGPIFTRYIKGQPPQKAWFIDAQEIAKWKVASNLHKVMRGDSDF